MHSLAECREVDVSVFETGVPLETDLYYEAKGNLVLLCPAADVDAEMLELIHRHAGFNDRLFVKNEAYEPLLRRSRRQRAERTRAEFLTQYGTMHMQSNALFQRTIQTGALSKASTDAVSREVVTTLEKTGLSPIIEGINRSRGADEYLYAHSVNVSLLNGLMGKWLGLTPTEVKALADIGLLHDIGKIRIPPQIVNKPGKLTEGEFRVMKMHAVCSYDIARAAGGYSEAVLAGIRSHHEKVNGSGYPDNLESGEIPLFARICAISDLYDAMIAARAYKEAASPFNVLAEFAKSRFAYLDIALVEVFLDRIPYELAGQKVKMSDGSVGLVEYVDRYDFAHPIVSVGGRVFTTDGDVTCVALVQE